MPPLEQSLWETISQIAESVKDIPSWQMGSAQNRRNEDISEQDVDTGREPSASDYGPQSLAIL
jgi:hypothetical protein